MTGSNAFEEDEINLLDLFEVLIKYKRFILWTVILAGIAAVVVSLLMTNVYRSEAVITPRGSEKLGGLGGVQAGSSLSLISGGMLGLGGDSDLGKLEVVLTSHDLAKRVVKKYGLISALVKDGWHPIKKLWLTDNHPTEQDACMVLDEMLSISTDVKKDIISIKVEHEDPNFAQQLVEHYLTELSESLREDTLNDAREKQKFFQEQLTQTADALLKEKIYSLLTNEIEKEIFTRAPKYYSFELLDPPIVPDLDKKIKPKRVLICILSMICAFFLAIFVAFFFPFKGKIKKNCRFPTN